MHSELALKRFDLKRNVAFAAGAVAVGAATTLQPHLVIASIAAAVLLTFALTVPPAWLPGSALALFLALPTSYLPLPPLLGRFFTPSIVVLGVWEARVLLARARVRPAELGRSWRLVGSALTCWLLLGSLISLSPQRSMAWSVVFGTAFLAAGAAANASGSDTRRAFERAWLWSALLFGALGCLEGLTHWNPLAAHYVTDGSLITQHWSVYRIETTLGHPLTNALVFATLAAGAGMIALVRPRPLSVGAALCSCGAVAFTGSRAGALALVVGIGIGVLCALFSRRTRAGWRIAAVVVLALASAGVWSAPVLRHREASKEGQLSSAYRSQLTAVAWQVAKRDSYLGSGPGTSQRRLGQEEPKTLQLENSPLQLLVSLGLPGLLAFTALFASAVWGAIRRRRWEGAAALVAALVASTGFNGWEQVPVTLVMLGAALVLALTRDGVSVRRIDGDGGTVERTRTYAPQASGPQHTSRSSPGRSPAAAHLVCDKCREAGDQLRNTTTPSRSVHEVRHPHRPSVA